MIIKNKKYLMSKGLAFYAELESQRFEDQLEKGWLIESINWLGYYRFKKVEPESKQFVIDFYTGKKSEVEEYVDIYTESDWEEVTSYRNKYFVFKASKEAISVYTDEESFLSRLNKEFWWFMKNVFIFFGISLILALMINKTAIRDFLIQSPIIYNLISFLLLAGLVTPFVAAMIFGYFKLFYAKRATYFNQPKKYAKRQSFFRDLILIMLFSGVIGGISGFIVGFFNLF